MNFPAKLATEAAPNFNNRKLSAKLILLITFVHQLN